MSGFLYIYIYVSQFIGFLHIQKHARRLLLMGVIVIYIYIQKTICETFLYTQKAKKSILFTEYFLSPNVESSLEQ